MNYYERHLGDYARDTGHLTMLEHGAYSLLLDRYYITEKGIEADQAHRIARARTREEKAAVDVVLSEFFKLVDGRWVQGRAEGEIAEANKRIETARTNGKNGGRPRKQNATQEEPSGLFLDNPNETQTKALQSPDSKHQLPHTPSGVEVRFEKFWEAYPKKVGKDAASKAFAKRKPDVELLAVMLEAVRSQASSPGWAKDGGQFIPNPATWLSQGRWQDGESVVADAFEGAR